MVMIMPIIPMVMETPKETEPSTGKPPEAAMETVMDSFWDSFSTVKT